MTTGPTHRSVPARVPPCRVRVRPPTVLLFAFLAGLLWTVGLAWKILAAGIVLSLSVKVARFIRAAKERGESGRA